MWSIGELKNEPKISKKCAAELFKAQDEEYWHDADDVMQDGKLYFNPDHKEHMDFLHDENIVRVLCKYKVKGDICFGCLEGVDAGSFWGYRFDGKGGMVELDGEVVFKEKVKNK